MRKECAVCLTPFEAQRRTAKYCSKRCRVRKARQPKPAAAEPVALPQPPDVGDGFSAATLSALADAGRVDSPSGQAALLLARRIESPTVETGSSVAAMVREHRAAMADALKNAESAVNPLDELRARRERKRAAG